MPCEPTLTLLGTSEFCNKSFKTWLVERDGELCPILRIETFSLDGQAVVPKLVQTLTLRAHAARQISAALAAGLVLISNASEVAS